MSDQIVDVSRDEDRVSVLVDSEDVSVLASADRDAEEEDVRDILDALEEELEVGLAVLSSADQNQSTDQDVREAVGRAATVGGLRK